MGVAEGPARQGPGGARGEADAFGDVGVEVPAPSRPGGSSFYEASDGASTPQNVQRLTTGYEYEAMAEVADRGGEAWREYDEFMSRIFHSVPEVRKYVMELFAASAANVILQVIVFHHNLQGSNGKSTLFALLKAAFGELMVKCAASALSGGGKGGPNEELASVKGARIAQFTEPDSKVPLNAAFIKDLTGGDEQSARRLFEHKSTFVFSGMAHVLCNKIPSADDMDGGFQRRSRCVPYGSRFVDAPTAPSGDPGGELPPNCFVKQSGLSEKFVTWKYCMMSEVLEAAAAAARRSASGDRSWHSAVPPVVLAATAELIRRESDVAAFRERRMERTGAPADRVTLAEIRRAFSTFCIRKGRKGVKVNGLKAELVGFMGEMTTASYGGLRNFWPGWRLLPVPPPGGESDDVDEGQQSDGEGQS